MGLSYNARRHNTDAGTGGVPRRPQQRCASVPCTIGKDVPVGTYLLSYLVSPVCDPQVDIAKMIVSYFT